MAPWCAVQVASLLWLGPDDVCGGHAVAIPCVLALPYACRFFQCCRQYSDTREKNCLLNGEHPGADQPPQEA